jgi:TetR/AcrR family transcriptional repressor of nem operon
LIRHGQADGFIPADVEQQSNSRPDIVLLQGMRLIGKTGRSRKE